MSQPNTNPNIQNGLPYKWDGSKNVQFPPYAINNGLGSSQSSRDSSPIPKYSNVPLSQLPPGRGQIPSSQLPPGRPSVSPIVSQQSDFKSANYFTSTPQSSPLTVNTSTPIMRKTEISAGNTVTGKNSLVNVSSSSESVPPIMPIDSNVRMSRISPIQTNGSQGTNTRQNLNQPIVTSQYSDMTKPGTLYDKSGSTGNLLTSPLDQPLPSFVPVNSQMMFPVPPSSQQSDKNTSNQLEQKPQATQPHFMNPTQSRFGPSTQSTPINSQNQPQIVSSSNTMKNISNTPMTNFLQSAGHQEKTGTNSPLTITGPVQQPPLSSTQQNELNLQATKSTKQTPEHTKNDSKTHESNIMQSRISHPQFESSVTNQHLLNQKMTLNQDARDAIIPNKTNMNPLLGGVNTNVVQSNNQVISTPQSLEMSNNQYVPPQNSHQQYKPLNPLDGPPINQMSLHQSMPPQNTGLIKPAMSQNPYMRTNPNTGFGNQQIRPAMTKPNHGNQQLVQPVATNQQGLTNTSQNSNPPTQNLGNYHFQTFQSSEKSPMVSTANQNLFPAPMSSQNQQGMLSQNVVKSAMTTTSNQGAGVIYPQPVVNQQPAGMQQYPPVLTSKNVGKPPMSNQNTGVFQPSVPNQQRPPVPNQNLGNQQFPHPTQNMNQFRQPNIQNYPSQNLYNQQSVGLQNQQYAETMTNQNAINAPPTSMVANPLSGPPILNQKSNEPIRPPMYNHSIEPQKQENATYPTTPTSSIHVKRYPQTNYQQSSTTYSTQNRQNAPNQMYQQSYGQNYQNVHQGMSNMNLGPSGFNRLYGTENVDLLQCPNILPPEKMELPKVCLGQECLNNANCSPEIFRCTMSKIPETNSLLQKSRLPLGVLIHPFKDLNHLPVIQCSSIVRCRACRTYINPFVYFVDTKRWKCNLCYRVNELPEEFQYDPVSKSYGDPSRRPEIKASTIEYIAPSEYMLRPPQPAVYLFLLDVSRLAIESGYLHTICEVLTSQLPSLPGDSRTQIGFIAYNSTLHFYSLGEGLSQPHEMTVIDIDDVFLPCPDNLLVNLKERMELVSDLLALLPTRFNNSYDNGSALGAAIQAAFKMMSATGGRVTIFQATLPTVGPGALTSREDPNQRAGKEAPHLNPATDFYKRLALECSGHQVAVDLFVVNSQYVDIATLSGISRFSGGCIHHFPLFKASKADNAESLERCFRRYLTRKIGFEAVMRIRCTRGLAIHTFHGNFFVRSTDLLSLPNINPDAGFGMQVSIEESLSDLQSVCFQAALLYTSSKGERRIRVHTLCLPVANNLPDILNSADQQCIVGILSKMAVDRSLQTSLSDARDAFINVAIDVLHSYKMSLNMGEAVNGLLASQSLKLLPLYILALLKHVAFRSGLSTRLDDRVFAMCEMKTLPLYHLIQQVYPDLYPIHNLTDEGGYIDPDGVVIPQPPRIQLTSRNIDAFGVYLLDCGQQMIIFVCQKAPTAFLTHVLGVPSFNSISDQYHELPKLENADNQRLHTFIASLNDEKPYSATLHIMRENSPNRNIFLEKLVEDRMESALSYNEFLQHIKTQVK